MISTASFVWAGFALAVGFLLPVLAPVFWHKKTGTRGLDYFIGAGTFIIFALTLEQILHIIMNVICGEVLKTNMTIYAIYGGLAAGIFEETGRYLAMKLVMRKNLNKDSAIMYGIGHAGCECFILLGFSMLSTIISLAAINSGKIEAQLAVLTDENAAVARAQIDSMLAARPIAFAMGGFEHLSTFILQIFLSILIYLAVSEGKKQFYPIAILIHAFLDFITVYMSTVLLIKTGIIEIILGLVAAVMLAFILYFYKFHSDNKLQVSVQED